MNILMFSRYVFPRKGGVEKHVWEIAKIFRKKGHGVDVICEKDDKKLGTTYKIDKINVRRICYPRVKYVGLLIIWIKLLKYFGLIKKARVVIVHDVFVWYLPLRVIFPLKKIILVNHGWEGKYPVPWKNKLIKKISGKLSNRVINVGDYIEKYYGVNPDEVVYGGVKKKKLVLGDKRKTVCVLGRLEEDTGVLGMLRVIKKMKGYEVLFCGDGTLRKKCEQYGKVLGFTDPETELEKSKICFATGYLSCLESMINGCITACFWDNKLKRDYFKDSPFSNFIIAGNNEDDILKEIYDLERSEDKRNIFIKRAYNWAASQSWERVFQVYGV